MRSSLRVLVAALAVGGLLGSGCASDAGGPVAEPPAPSRASREIPALGFAAPHDFEFWSLSWQDQSLGAFTTAAPGAFSARSTWRAQYQGALSATLVRLAFAPGYPIPSGAPEVDELLASAAAAPNGSDSYRVFSSQGVRVGRAHWGWIDSFAWIDPRGDAVWVLTEGFDPHGDSWPALIGTLIAAQANA